MAETGGLLLLFRHKTWATLQLIDHCRRLDPEELEATTPGTFGTIRETLQHLVAAEEHYLATLVGEAELAPLTDDLVPLEVLAERIRRLGPRWEALAEDAGLAGREVATGDRWCVPATVPLAQAIHHADDHRSHVLSILGAKGREVPDLDLWRYAEVTGQMHRAGQPPSNG